MSDLSEIRRAIAQLPVELRESFRESVSTGLDALRKPEDISLETWAHRHYYLSAESSQREEVWRAWPIQIGILHCLGNDNIEEFWFYKSARLGWTKCLLADIGYTAQHQRRNQGLWLPKDADRDDFVKTDLDPMLRDVKIMRKVFPRVIEKSKDNTLLGKRFLGSLLKLRGGHAAGNYRRLTLAKGRADEIDGFDLNIEGAGTPDMLIKKRVEGATHPKVAFGSTGRKKGLSHIERGHDACDVQLQFHIECPHCEVEHPLVWGGDKVKYGMKWDMADPEGTVRHHCPHCHEPITQADYLELARVGAWVSADGKLRLVHWWDEAGEPHAQFTDAEGNPCLPPKKVGARAWTAYSEQPGVTWGRIVREFLDALKAWKEGNRVPMVQWVNETKGETYEDDGDKADVNALHTRAKESNYSMRTVPWGCLILGAGVDVQDDRFEITVWGEGRGEEMFEIDYCVIEANPAILSEWDKLWNHLQLQYRHVSGAWLGLSGAAVDTGGHFTHQAYAFVAKYQAIAPDFRLFAIKGSSNDGDPIKARAAKWMDINLHGRVVKKGVKLWMVGTDTAKDLFYGRIKVTQPGPGYVHFAKDTPETWFKQFGNEKRLQFTVQGRQVHRWIHMRGNNEAIDTTVYALFVFEALNVARFDDRRWQQLEQLVAAPELFDDHPPANAAVPAPDEAPEGEGALQVTTRTKPERPQPAARTQASAQQAPNPFASEEWLQRG
jgi:phage terminase large subunit GpA-like protein